MSRLALRFQTPIAATITGAKRWTSSLGIWGATAGIAGVLILSVTPLFRREVMEKVPLLRSYYEDKTPASDKPF